MRRRPACSAAITYALTGSHSRKAQENKQKSETDEEEWAVLISNNRSPASSAQRRGWGSRNPAVGEGSAALFTLTCRAMFPFFQGSLISARRKETVACRMASCNQEHGESDRLRRSIPVRNRVSFLPTSTATVAFGITYRNRLIDNRSACGSSLVTRVT